MEKEGVITVLSDHNMEGQAMMLWGTLVTEGWLDLYPLKIVTFTQVDLPKDSSDRVVWRFAQENDMLLITGNRRMKGEDSLEQTLREENTSTSPVITVSDLERVAEVTYREKCLSKLLDIVLDLENFRGTERLFIP